MANVWNDISLKKEINNRTREYEKGTAKLYKFEGMKDLAIDSYKKERCKM